jgi:5-methyltetrahydrofolate--homocysteine methyltransferase
MSDIIAALKDFVVRGKRNEAAEEMKKALAAGLDPGLIMKEGLISAMSVVGQKYSSGEFFLPQMMIAARAMTTALEHLKPHLVANQASDRKEKAVIGTVSGDFHDIGKNIVKLMLEGASYEVIDLGVDVSADKFVEAVRRESPRFVLMSALITLTMESMRQTVAALNDAGVRERVRIGIGGAPVTQKFCSEIGADSYSEDAYGCVQKCNQFAT